MIIKFNNMRLAITIIITLIIFSSCQHDLEKPSWEIDVTSPLIHTKIDINNILIDSNISIGNKPDSSIILIYNYPISKIELEEELRIEEQFYYKSKLDSLNLVDVSTSYKMTLNELFASQGWPCLNGLTIPIPPINNIAGDTVSVNANEYFETMDLISGIIEVKIYNGLPFDITDVNLILRNVVNNNIIISTTFPIIPSYTTESNTIQISNMLIDANMIAEIQNINIPGTGLDSVVINCADSLVATLIVKDLVASEATAYWPEQDIFTSFSEQFFNIQPAELTEFKIKSGWMNINATSTLEDTMTLEYNIPSFTNNNIPFASSLSLNPATNGNLSILSRYFDLSNHILDLTGEKNRKNGDTINTIYTELTGKIDSTGELVTLNLEDSITSTLSLNIIPEYFKGFLGTDTINFGPEEETVDFFSSITSGSFTLNNSTLKLNINNYIGAEVEVIINEITAINSENNITKTLQGKIVNSNIFIDNATESNNIIIPNNSDITIDDKSSNLKELIEIMPDKFIASVTIITNPNGNKKEGFLYYDQTVDLNITYELPLSFISDELTLSNTSEINFDNNIEDGNFKLIIQNYFPIEANIKLYLIDKGGFIFDSLLTQETVKAGIINNNGIVTSPTETIINIYRENINNFNNAKNIMTVVSFTTLPSQNKIKIYDDYKLELTIVGDFNYLIE